jgi:hypothetical protein
MTVLSPFLARDLGAPPREDAASAERRDATRVELDAMQAMADALASLPDERMRARVLAWALEVVPVDDSVTTTVTSHPPPAKILSPLSAAAPRSTPATPPAYDQSLSIEGIEALFDDDPRPSPGRFPPTPYYYGRRRRLSPRVQVRIRWWG